MHVFYLPTISTSLCNEISCSFSQINNSLLLRAASLLTFKYIANYELSIMYHNVIAVHFISLFIEQFINSKKINRALEN